MSATKWVCKKCGRGTTTPLPVEAITCTCTVKSKKQTAHPFMKEVK